MSGGSFGPPRSQRGTNHGTESVENGSGVSRRGRSHDRAGSTDVRPRAGSSDCARADRAGHAAYAGHDVKGPGAALLRSGSAAAVCLQSCRIDSRLPRSCAARSRSCDGVLGTSAGFRAQPQRTDDAGQRPAGVCSDSTSGRRSRTRDAARAGAHRSALAPVRRGRQRRSRRPRSSVRHRHARGRRAFWG
jgi:hypothetical protein